MEEWEVLQKDVPSSTVSYYRSEIAAQGGKLGGTTAWETDEREALRKDAP